MNITHTDIFSAAPGAMGRGPTLTPEALKKMEESVKSRQGDFQPGEDFGITLLKRQADPQEPGPDARLSTVFTGEEVSDRARTLSWLMDESRDIESYIGFNLSREQLAQHVGEIGRKIDEAFSAGEITQGELDDLNAGLARYAENVTGQAERREAMWGVMRQMAASTQAMVESGASREEMAEYAKRNMDSMQERISEFVEKHTAIDRTLIAALIARAREGTALTGFQVEKRA